MYHVLSRQKQAAPSSHDKTSIIFWDLLQVLFLPQAIHGYVLFFWTHTVNELGESVLEAGIPTTFILSVLLVTAGWGCLRNSPFETMHQNSMELLKLDSQVTS